MYFVNVSILLDAAFTPAVLEAIDRLLVTREQTGINGRIILGVSTRVFNVEVDSERIISEEVPPIMERDWLYIYRVCDFDLLCVLKIKSSLWLAGAVPF